MFYGHSRWPTVLIQIDSSPVPAKQKKTTLEAARLFILLD